MAFLALSGSRRLVTRQPVCTAPERAATHAEWHTCKPKAAYGRVGFYPSAYVTTWAWRAACGAVTLPMPQGRPPVTWCRHALRPAVTGQG